MALKVDEANGQLTIFEDALGDGLAADKDVIGGPIIINGIVLENASGDACHAHLYDSVDPTLGTTEPIAVLVVAANSKRVINFGDQPLVFNNALSMVATSSAAGGYPADSNSSDPGTDVKIHITAKRGS